MKKNAFSLVELMVGVAIIGVLSSIAIPTYLSYSTKARIANAISVLEGLKKTAMENYTANNVFPTIPNATQPNSPYTDSIITSSKISAATAYRSVTVTAPENIIGYVQITFGDRAPDEIKGAILGLVAIESPNTIRWQCINGDNNGANLVNSNLLPSICR